ncbi:MAG: RNA polymerase sigma factor [Candidatus Kerfeldbacteria bacterium]|nr:RNA polymerase sigma factor [Candidatus Kerfeldbacteria bacterium]
MPESQTTDEELARQVQTGHMASFAELVRRYQDKLLRYGSRFLRGSPDVEDIVQEVMIKAYRNINSYNTQQRFSPWIYRIAHNAFVDVLKRRHLEAVPFFNPDELWPHPQATDNPVLDTDRTLIRQQLEKCLNDLAAKYREPLVLRYFDDLSYKEISNILRIPVGTVSIRLKRGLQQLQTIYRDNGYHL